MIALPRQCAVLVGGMGTRLGDLTAATPKPLLDCGDRPFLAWVLRELARFGIDEFILLTGHFSSQLAAFAADSAHYLPKAATVKLSREPAPAGTGGALWHAKDLLDDRFLVVNGDSWCDTNLARFIANAISQPRSVGHVLLTQVADSSRYGIVQLSGPGIVAFREKSGVRTPGTINCGMYVFRKDAFDFIGPVCSLETDVLPRLSEKGLLTGQTMQGYFIDIGIPNDYARAKIELPNRLHRPAVFIDRDDVLIRHLDQLDCADHFRWIEGAQDAVSTIADSGFHVFMTNYAALARGYGAVKDVAALHAAMLFELRKAGGTIDDLRAIEFALGAQKHDISDKRTLDSNMIIDLAERWKIDRTRSFLIGAKNAALQAAAIANIPSHRFSAGSLQAFVKPLLADQ